MSVVLVTGCSSGFGELIALEFARAGDEVYASMRNAASALTLTKQASRENLSINIIELDVCDRHSIESAVQLVTQQSGCIDVLVNNAGTLTFGSVESISDQNFHQVMDTNFWGALNLTRAVLPCMRKRRGGMIIMMSSLSALIGLPGDSAYAASKAALERATESLYVEVQNFGIKVRIVQPGVFNTRLAVKAINRGYDDISDYQSLNQHIKAEIEKGGGDDPSIVAKKILDVAYSDDQGLYFPVGSQACDVSRQIASTEGRTREQLLLELSHIDG